MSEYDRLSDMELLPLLKSKDAGAFKEIYNRYWQVLYLHAKHMLRDKENARDVVQEIFTNLWNHAESMKASRNLGGYLYHSTRNAVLNAIRHSKHLATYQTNFLKEYAEATTNTEWQLEVNELRTLIDRHIAQLPPKMKLVFELSRKQHLSHAQIAEQLQISDLTVKKQISKALSVLKHRLDSSAMLVIVLVKFFFK